MQEGRYEDIGQTALRQMERRRSLDAAFGRHVDVDVAAHEGIVDLSPGLDDAKLAVAFPHEVGTDLARHGQAVAGPNQLLDARASRFGHVPEKWQISPCPLVAGQEGLRQIGEMIVQNEIATSSPGLSQSAAAAAAAAG